MKEPSNGKRGDIQEIPSREEGIRNKAEELARSPEKLERFLDKAEAKTEREQGRILSFIQDLQLLIRFIRAYMSGEYRKIPWRVIIMVLIALIYFVNPLDIVPDFLGTLGFLDDATVIGLVINAIREELEEFKAFLGEESASGQPNSPAK